MIKSNVEFDAIKGLKYGKGFLGPNMTLKTRYKREIVERLLLNLDKRFHTMLKIYVTQDQEYCFVAIIQPEASAIWYAFELALNKAKKHVVPTQLKLL